LLEHQAIERHKLYLVEIVVSKEGKIHVSTQSGRNWH